MECKDHTVAIRWVGQRRVDAGSVGISCAAQYKATKDWNWKSVRAAYISSIFPEVSNRKEILQNEHWERKKSIVLY